LLPCPGRALVEPQAVPVIDRALAGHAQPLAPKVPMPAARDAR